MVNPGYLKWQLRRGKLELDMVLQRFIERYPLEAMDDSELEALLQLLESNDEHLLDLFLLRPQVENAQAAGSAQAQLVEKIIAASVPE